MPFADANAANNTVEISVNATTESSLSAKNKALSQGEVEAVKKYLLSINPSANVEQIDSAKASSMIDSFEIVSEKVGARSYSANVRYKISDFASTHANLGTAVANPSNQPMTASDSSATLSTAGQKILLLTTVNGLKDWLSIYDRLRLVSGVNRVDLSAFSLTQVDMLIYSNTALDELKSKMEESGFKISANNGYWILER